MTKERGVAVATSLLTRLKIDKQNIYKQNIFYKAALLITEITLSCGSQEGGSGEH